MEKLEFLTIARLQNDEHYQYMTDFRDLVEKATAAELGITDLLPPFITAFSAEDATMKVELGSAKSPLIRKLDKTRGRTWNALKQRIEATVICPIEAEAIAAEALKRVIDLYGDKRSAPYNIESASLTNLVADLLSPKNKPYLETLSITSWVNALKTQNEEFQALFNERNEELAGRQSGNTEEFRVKVDEKYEEIIDHINATIVLKTAKPGVEKFVKELNEKIKYYKNVISIRKGRKLPD